MKLVWSPETASKAYIDTVKSCEIFQDSGEAELISAMAAGWNARFIVEAWSAGSPVAASVGLAVAARHARARHACVVPDEASRSEYLRRLGESSESAEVIVGDPEEAMASLAGADFVVVDCLRRDFAAKTLRSAELSDRGAVLVCKNAAAKSVVVLSRSRRLVRSVFLPVGNGLDIAHVGAISGEENESPAEVKKREGKWIKHVDRRSGEEHVIRK